MSSANDDRDIQSKLPVGAERHYHCKRCNSDWIVYNDVVPFRCPNPGCRTRAWNVDGGGLADINQEDGDYEPYPLDLSYDIINIGISGPSSKGKTTIATDFMLRGFQELGLEVLTNNPIRFEGLKSTTQYELKKFFMMPEMAEKKYAVLMDEIDKLLHGRNFSEAENKRLGKLVSDIRRFGVKILVSTWISERGADKQLRDNVTVFCVPTHKYWVHPDTGEKYPTFWTFNSFSDYIYANELGKNAREKTYEEVAKKYRTANPLSIIAPCYNSKELIPMQWGAPASDDDILRGFEKFKQWGEETGQPVVSANYTFIRAYIDTWFREEPQDVGLLEESDKQSIATRVLTLALTQREARRAAKEKEKLARSEMIECICGKRDNRSNMEKHFAKGMSHKPVEEEVIEDKSEGED